MLQTDSPQKFNFLSDSPRATFLEVNKVSFPNFLLVTSLIIIISDLEAICNFIFILLIVTDTSFLFEGVSFDNLLIFFFSLVDFTQCIYCVGILFIPPPFWGGFATNTLMS